MAATALVKIERSALAAASLLSSSRSLRSGRCSASTLRAKASPPVAGPSTISSIRPFLSASAAEIGSPADDHLDRKLGTHRAGQALRGRRRPAAAELHLGQAEAGFLDRDAIMAGERDLEAAAERGAVDRGNERLRELSIAISTSARPGGFALAELRDVGAGDEGAAAAVQHDRLDLGSAMAALTHSNNAARTGHSAH